MEYQEYINKKKKLYDALLQFIEEETLENHNYLNLTTILDEQEILENKEETTLFLSLLVKISNNHHRLPNFFKKIEKILQFFFTHIKQTFSNFELFELIKSNKQIVLIFIEQQILIVDREIAKEIIYSSQITNTKYHFFFYPEIKEFLNVQEIEKIETKLKEKDPDIFINFKDKRKMGENEQYICELIRNDSVESFVSYVNRKNLTLSNVLIKPSIFETNNTLCKKESTLIEYAAFYGSIQIFQYLKFNDIELTPSLWIYAIHSQNAELIHILEENSVHPPNDDYQICFNESVKCHHNDIANYIRDIFLNHNKINNENIYKNFNFEQMPSILENNIDFYYICRYSYSNLVDFYIKEIQKKYNDKILYHIFLILL